MPVRDFFVAMGFSEEEIARESRNVQKLFHSIYEPRIAKIRTRGGARQLLQFLKDRNIEAVILSNHTKEGLQNQLERLGIGHHFSRVITNDMHATMERKNKADKLAYLVKKSSYKKNEILIIGDSPEEAEAGKRAGIRTVAITGGYYSTRRLKEAKPDYLIHNLLDMIDIIKKVECKSYETTGRHHHWFGLGFAGHEGCSDGLGGIRHRKRSSCRIGAPHAGSRR